MQIKITMEVNMIKTRILSFFCILLATLLLACSCDFTPVTDSSVESSSEESTEKESDSKTEASNDTEETESTTSESTTSESTAPENTKVIYKVTVVDGEGNALAGAFVQLCVGDICKLPSATDAEGVATFEFDEAEYTVKVNLDGYTGEASYTFPEGSAELTITLTKDAE